MDEQEQFVVVPVTDDDLLYHRNENIKDLKLRIINTVTGSSIIGIVTKETDDSLLVALPSRLMSNNDGDKGIEPYMPVRAVRVLKTTTLAILPCFGEFEVYFIKYLLDIGKGQYPELITSEYEERLRNRLDELKELVDKYEKESEQEHNAIDFSVTKMKIEDLPDNSFFVAPEPGKQKH